MVKVEGKYFDGYLKSFMDQLDKAVEEKWDGLFYIAGQEGSGKSTLAFQMASYLDKNFSNKNIVFDGDSFIRACINAPPKTCIVFDESYMVFNNSNHANKLTVKIKTMLTMVRSKQLFMIIVSPTFFDINKYLIIHRSRAFINVYANNMKRGFFSFYNTEKKLKLYYKGKRDHNIYAESPHFRGRFTNWSPVDLEDYEARKQQAVKDLEKEKDEKKGENISLDNIEDHKSQAQTELILFLKKMNLLKFGALKRVAEDYLEITPKALDHRTRNLRNSRVEKSLSGVPELL